MKRLLLLIGMLFLLYGCASDFKEIRKTAVSRAFILNSSDTFSGYYYLGSDSTYHYFLSKWKFGPDEKFKIRKTEMLVNGEIPFDSKEIRIYETKPEKQPVEIFSKVGNTELYWKK